MEWLYIIVCIIVAYLFGSIPFGLVIGKVFYHKDIREYGSKNIGGTNAGRVLGKKIGFLVIMLDALKCALSMLIGIALFYLFGYKYELNQELYTNGVILAGLFAGIGHCYPIFVKFNGGKAASTSFGFIFMSNILIGAACFVLFFTTLFTSKYVSLSSILCAILVIVMAWVFYFTETLIGMNFGLVNNLVFTIAITLMCLLLIYRHKSNIVRLFNKEENKIKWLSKKSK